MNGNFAKNSRSENTNGNIPLFIQIYCGLTSAGFCLHRFLKPRGTELALSDLALFARKLNVCDCLTLPTLRRKTLLWNCTQIGTFQIQFAQNIWTKFPTRTKYPPKKNSWKVGKVSLSWVGSQNFGRGEMVGMDILSDRIFGRRFKTVKFFCYLKIAL